MENFKEISIRGYDQVKIKIYIITEKLMWKNPIKALKSYQKKTIII